VRAAAGGSRRVLVVICPDWPPDASAVPGAPVMPGTPAAPGPGPDARAFEQVVTVVEEFCPQVEVLRPGACALSARGPARYFGGEEALARKITAAVASRGFGCRAGVADGLFAAQLAAQAGPSGLVVAAGRTPAFLAPHPVSVLGSPELADLLPRLGIWTLGEFAALSAAEAGSRFGAQGALAHRLARGADPRPLALRPPSADLSVQLDFDPPAEQTEPVIFAAKMLAERMHAGLAARGLACVRVQIQAVCADGREITRLWRHDGLLSALAVAERVRWQLAGWQANQDGPSRDGAARDGAARDGAGHAGSGWDDPSHAGSFRPATGQSRRRAPDHEGIQVGGITLLRLTPDQLVRDEGHQLGLWGDAFISDRVARAAVRVQAMLGHGAVTRPTLAGGRSPAEQVTLVPFGDASDPMFPADRPWPAQIPVPAPATVYPVPLPAVITDDGGANVTVTGRALVSAPPARLSADGGPWLAVTSWAGPWPVTERWWDPASARRRARFQLVTEDGNAWLAVVQEGHWLVEACYD
jgi:protein ImuB